jgi:glucose/arabinose dehydrogenase/PKD repeat protein
VLPAKLVAYLLGAACLLAAAAPAAAAATFPKGFQDSVVVAGLNEPTAVRFAADGRVFVAEKSGRVLVYDGLDDESPTLFADLRLQVFNGSDRGLLGLALDPRFPLDPYVYVLYSHDAPIGGEAPVWGVPGDDGDGCPDPPGSDSDGCVISARLSRLTADGDHMSSEQVLIEDWCQQFSSHSIGDLQFGPDGALYASGGDGASFISPDYGQFGYPQKNPCGDPPVGLGGTQAPPSAEGGALRSQDVLTPADPTGLDGSIVRVDPETGLGLPGNPMYGSADANAGRIVAFGFRNPFRFAINAATNEVYTGNVGWDGFEEIDRFNATPSLAYNSGWPCFEGDQVHPIYVGVGLNVCEQLYGAPGSVSSPFFDYAHGQPLAAGDECPKTGGAALSGLVFYDGESFPSSYDGALFFADSVRGCIWAMFPDPDGRPDPSTLTIFGIADGELYPGVDLEVGPGGDLYYVALFDDEGFGPGAIHRVSYFSGNQPPIARLGVDRQWSVGDLESVYDATGSVDPDGGTLTYEWDLNGDGVFGEPTAEGKRTWTFADSTNHTVTVRVVDAGGATSIDRVTVYPEDTPPQPQILFPGAGHLWRVGEEIAFEGAAGDSEDGALPGSDFDWSARLYHCPQACHAHPLQAFPAVAAASFAAPDHDYPAYIELTLTVADSRGLAASRTVRLDPRVVELNVSSNPPGVPLGAGARSAPAPFAVQAIEGSTLVLSAPAAATVGGASFPWVRWSDGGDRVHSVVVDGPATYAATYAVPPPPARPLAEPPASSSPPRLRTILEAHPAKRSRRATAGFGFSSTGPGSGFRCKLDGLAAKPCRSPRTYMNLRPGWHTFRVAATDDLGNVDPSPAVFSWRVLPVLAR